MVFFRCAPSLHSYGFSGFLVLPGYASVLSYSDSTSDAYHSKFWPLLPSSSPWIFPLSSPLCFFLPVFLPVLAIPLPALLHPFAITSSTSKPPTVPISPLQLWQEITLSMRGRNVTVLFSFIIMDFVFLCSVFPPFFSCHGYSAQYRCFPLSLICHVFKSCSHISIVWDCVEHNCIVGNYNLYIY